MKLHKITIENYRQYEGENVISISVDPDKNFTIIQGDNGGGKSNIMNAIIWCIYGDEMFRSKNEGREIINETVLQRLADGDSADVSVTVIIADEESKYEFKRKITYTKAGSQYIKGRDIFSGKEITNEKGWTPISNPEWTIEKRFIPKDLRGFFFFDGEKLQEYFEDTSRVKINVEKIAQINALNSTISTLKEVQRSYSHDMSKLKPDQSNNIYNADVLEQEKDEANTKKNEIEERLPEINARKCEIDAYLRDNSDAVVKGIQQIRTTLENQLSDIIKKRNRNEEDIKSFISERAAILFSIQSIISSKKLIDEETKKGVLPPNIRDVFVKDLLEKGVCICGRNLSENESCRKNVESLLEQIIPSEIANDAVSARYILSSMIDKKEFKNDYANLLRTRMNCNDDISDLTDQIDAESDKLSKYNIEEIGCLEEERKKLESEERQLLTRRGALGNRIVSCEKKLSELKETVEMVLRSEQKTKRLQNQKDYAKHLEKIMSEFKEEIVEEVRQQLEEKTRDYFFNMIWKKKAFSNVQIMDDGKQYKISVKSEFGRECLGDISTGEKQVLALSFTAALYSISGYSVPVIIDTPFGRISETPRENIAKALPSYLSETQVIILATDTEYTNSVRENLKEKVGQEYKINHNEGTKTSKVVAYD